MKPEGIAAAAASFPNPDVSEGIDTNSWIPYFLNLSSTLENSWGGLLAFGSSSFEPIGRGYYE